MDKRISPLFMASDWPTDLDNRQSPNWKKGIEILQDRFDGRYFKPLDVLINHTNRSVSANVGFIIMSIDCLMIETLNQFYLGLTKTTDRYHNKNTDPNFKWNWQAFRDYFKQSKEFTVFHGDDKLCNVFFDQIRCGLLHQAESKINSLINLKEAVVIKNIDDNNVNEGIVINRKMFHCYVEKDFKQYYSDLKNSDSKNIFGEYLRDKCNAKMKTLCS